ncbi:MAG: hypothetical protein ABJD11_01455 [Gemmatimonadota bacterium]
MVERHIDDCPNCDAERRFDERLANEIRKRLEPLPAPERLRAQISAMLAVERKFGS